MDFIKSCWKATEGLDLSMIETRLKLLQVNYISSLDALIKSCVDVDESSPCSLNIGDQVTNTRP